MLPVFYHKLLGHSLVPSDLRKISAQVTSQRTTFVITVECPHDTGRNAARLFLEFFWGIRCFQFGI